MKSIKNNLSSYTRFLGSKKEKSTRDISIRLSCLWFYLGVTQNIALLSKVLVPQTVPWPAMCTHQACRTHCGCVTTSALSCSTPRKALEASGQPWADSDDGMRGVRGWKMTMGAATPQPVETFLGFAKLSLQPGIHVFWKHWPVPEESKRVATVKGLTCFK